MAVRIRRLLKRVVRRAVKPAAMALVAGGVALSLVVSTPSNAEAFVAPILPPPVLLGSGVMALPEAVGLVSLTGPIGWTILGATAVGVGLYATKDYWLPYVSGLWGEAAPGDTSTVTQGFALITPKISLGTPTDIRSGNSGLKVVGTNSTGNVNGSIYVAAAFKCKRPDGSMYTKNQGGSYPKQATFTVEARCTTAGDLVMEGQFGAYCNLTVSYFDGCTAKSTWAGPENVVSWGLGSGSPFDPKSPDVKYETAVECVRPDGSLFTIKATSTGADGALKMPSCDAASPGSHGTGKTAVTGFAPGQTVGKPLLDVPVIPAPANYPLCGAAAPGSGCKLAVKVDSKECVVGNWDCEHWADLKNDPNQSPRLSCQYGPYSVELNTCNPLERAYEQGGSPVNDKNTDGNTSTRADTDANGQQIPKTQAPGVGVTPGVGGTPSGVPGSSAEEGACWPTGWGMLNPLEWVYKPIVCASKALFQPKKDIQTRVNGMSAAFNNKIPVTWFGTGIEGVSGGTCPTSWAVTVSGQSYSLICGTPADGIIRAFRPVLGAMLIMAMLWPLIRSLFYSAIPVFKVNPS